METKKCPYCGNEIPAVAVKCKYCLEWLTEDGLPPVKTPPAPPTQVPPAPTAPVPKASPALAPTVKSAPEGEDPDLFTRFKNLPQKTKDIIYWVAGIFVFIVLAVTIVSLLPDGRASHGIKSPSSKQASARPGKNLAKGRSATASAKAKKDLGTISSGIFVYKKLTWTIPEGYSISDREYEDDAFSFVLSDKSEDSLAAVVVYEDDEGYSLDDMTAFIDNGVVEETIEALFEEAGGRTGSYTAAPRYETENKKGILHISRTFTLTIDGEKAQGFIHYAYVKNCYLIQYLCVYTADMSNSAKYAKRLDSFVSSLTYKK